MKCQILRLKFFKFDPWRLPVCLFVRLSDCLYVHSFVRPSVCVVDGVWHIASEHLNWNEDVLRRARCEVQRWLASTHRHRNYQLIVCQRHVVAPPSIVDGPLAVCRQVQHLQVLGRSGHQSNPTVENRQRRRRQRFLESDDDGALPRRVHLVAAVVWNRDVLHRPLAGGCLQQFSKKNVFSS